MRALLPLAVALTLATSGCGRTPLNLTSPAPVASTPSTPTGSATATATFQEAGPLLDSGGDGQIIPSVEASAGIAATMNDVSILFPLPSTAADINNLLAPSAIGAQGTLFPSALYASIGPITGTTDDPLPDVPENHGRYTAYDALRVVAMRIDPCFASLDPDPDGGGCTAQIRLVFQEVAVSQFGDAGAPLAFDSALHAFYDLSRTQFLTLAQALVDLRAGNEDGDVLGPLAPHPIMVRQGLDGAMSQGVQRLILEYAGEQNLVRAAEASGNNFGPGSIGSWLLSAFDVDGSPQVAIPMPIPTLTSTADSGSVVTQSIDGANSLANFFPTTTSADNYASLWQIAQAYLEGADAGGYSASDHQAPLDALVRVENPKDNSADTIDCASCHMATDTEQVVAMPLLSFDDTTSPLAFQPDGIHVTPSDMTVVFSPDDAPFGLNLHVFSYVETSPAISRRVVNETAAVVEYLNNLPL